MLTQRFDSVPIRNPRIDEQTGFLHVDRVPIAGAMVQPYRKADGSIDYEAKLPSEVLSDSTVSSANDRPVTDDHPSGLVTKDNAKDLMRGFTSSNAHVEGDMLFNDITITDADLINKIQNGKRELSIGFEAEIVPQKGEYKGDSYDTVQKNIRINHVAVVERGRAGHEVRLLGDSAEAVVNDISEKGKEMEVKTTKVRVDNADVTVAEQDADKILKLDADNSAKQKKIDELNAQIKELTAQRDALQGKADDSEKKAGEASAKADSAEKELADLKKKYEGDAFDKAIEERLALIDKIKPYVGDSYDFKGKSAKQMKLDAIKSVNDSVDLSDKPDLFIDAYFEGLSDNKPADTTPTVVGYGAQETETKDDSEDAYAKAIYARQHMFEGGK